MAKYNLNNNPNPFVISEPYFLPKYTGYVQNYKYFLGCSIGRASYLLMAEKPETTGALSSCRKHAHPSTMSCDEERMQEQDMEVLHAREPKDKFFLNETSFLPGYTGYVPRSRFMMGESFHKTCVKGITDMERHQQRVRKYLNQHYSEMEKVHPA